MPDSVEADAAPLWVLHHRYSVHLKISADVRIYHQGTNLPSFATPNGQAAFLFLLTSALAPLIRLSYVKMLWMALPYTMVPSTAGIIAIVAVF